MERKNAEKTLKETEKQIDELEEQLDKLEIAFKNANFPGSLLDPDDDEDDEEENFEFIFEPIKPIQARTYFTPHTLTLTDPFPPPPLVPTALRGNTKVMFKERAAPDEEVSKVQHEENSLGGAAGD